jgi:pantoate--beta-alanine ligase
MLEQRAIQQLQQQGFQPDYFNICQADTLAPAVANDNNLVILTAAKLGTTRLIDNLDFQIP